MTQKIQNFKSSYNAFKQKMIKKLEKTVSVCKIIFGYGIMISLFVGGLTMLGFVLAICVGGDLAAQICAVIKGYIIPAVTYTSTIMVLFGLVIMYMSGQSALTAKKTAKAGESNTPKKTATEAQENDEGER